MSLPQLKQMPAFTRHVVHPDNVPLGNNNFNYQPFQSTHDPVKRLSKKGQLERAEEALAWLKAHEGSSPFGFVFTDGTYDLFPSNECLGLINATERICRDKPVAFFISCRSFGSTLSNNTRKAVDWLINRSPYAEAFVTKNVDDACNKGIILKTDHCVAFVVAAAAVFRNIGGIANSMATWSEHVPEDIAFIFSHYFQNLEGGLMRFSDHYSWSSTLGKNIGVDGIKRFATHDFSLHDTTPMKEKPFRYSDFSHLWKTRDKTVYKKFVPEGETIKKKIKGWGGKDVTHTYEGVVKLDTAGCAKLMEQLGYPYA